MKFLSYLWAVLLTYSGILWLMEAARIAYDHSYHPTKFTLVLAFVITGGVVLKWAMEQWVQASEK